MKLHKGASKLGYHVLSHDSVFRENIYVEKTINQKWASKQNM